MTKFHKFLYGHQFTLVTDHKPLLTLLGPKSQIPPLATARLQHWALILTAYNYEIQFQLSAKHGNAEDLNDVSPAILFNMSQINTLPDLLKKATAIDPEVVRYIQKGLLLHVTSELNAFFQCKGKLIMETDCLLWGIRVVIPTNSGQKEVNKGVL